MDSNATKLGLGWRCNKCGIATTCENDCRVEEDQYVEGDSEPCVFCADGTATVEALPNDYEECGECGFDHQYAPAEAEEAHRKMQYGHW